MSQGVEPNPCLPKTAWPPTSLGQGVGSSVGVALGESYLNKKTNGVIDYYTYVLCGDGELEEGITYEALSLAGNLKLNKYIYYEKGAINN